MILPCRMYKDREQSPVAKAVWWIEYVCKYGVEGARKLRPITADVPWYSYHHVDIITVLLITLALVSYVLKVCLCACCCSKRKLKRE